MNRSKKLDAAYARFEAHTAAARAAAVATEEEEIIPGARRLLALADRLVALEHGGRPDLHLVEESK